MRRVAAALLAGVCLLWAPDATAAEHGPVGWASAGAGDPTAPKVIRVVGTVTSGATAPGNGHEADDGSLLGEQDYTPGYDFAKYMSCFGEDGTTWSDTRYDYCKQQRQLRQTGSNKERAQIQLTVPSNTTLVGVGRDARLLGVFLTVNTGTNIVVRNLQLESPVDHFTSWSPDDGTQGNWNARFDAMTVITGRNIRVDHCTFTDGRFPDDEAPVGFHGEPVQRHDGLLDIEDGSDFITASDSRFTDHDKALLIGSGDGRGDRDRGHLKVTFAFGYARSEPTVAVADYGGEYFHDTGSWFNGRPARLNAVASGLGLTDDVGWDPAEVYDYRALTSRSAVEHQGRPYGHS